MSTREKLVHRASMLAAVRDFFAARNVIEVDTPILSSSASIDTHIDLMTANCAGELRYLHSSPEHAMKRLLAQGSGDIYQLSHVFRDGEIGSRHNPEFTMLEWYRVAIPFEDLIRETADLCSLFLGKQTLEIVTYREAVIRWADVDPFSASDSALHNRLVAEGIDPFTRDRDDLLNLLLGTIVEPCLGREGLLALTNYPSSQAAMARTQEIDGYSVAERFELYYQGVELSNGYHELVDSKRLRSQFEDANRQRESSKKDPLPIDERFLAALDHLPDCCGVAVGIDRLLMLQQKVKTISEVIPFSWTQL